MDAIRTHLTAIRTESARMDPKERGVAGFAARERLVHRLEPLPERMAALNSRVTAKLEEVGGTFRQPAAGTPCAGLVDLALAAQEIADQTEDRDSALWWYDFSNHLLDQYDNECPED